MSQDLHDEITEILHEAETASGSMITGDGESDGPDLLETAERASDLFESADPDDLLEAVGLAELPDGSEPDSIPAAIAQGDPEQVEALQRLLHLANLADEDDGGALEGTIEAIQRSTEDEEAAESAAADGDDGATVTDGDDDAVESEDGDGVVRTAIESVTDDGDESESESGGARAAVESVAEGVSEASGLGDALGNDDADEPESDGDDADSADETGSGLGDQIRSAMESSVSDIGDDLEGLQERLQSRSASSAGSDAEDADKTADADDEDDGPLETDLGMDQEQGTSGGPTRHSTMPPPPSERADMKGTARHSTIPDKH